MPTSSTIEVARPLLIPRQPAFAMLGVGTTKGHELINSGRLDARKLGGKTLITLESIRALAEGLPRATKGTEWKAQTVTTMGGLN